jgi:hypothetical protein
MGFFAGRAHIVGVGHHHGADDFDMVAEPFGEEFADLFFNFRGIGYFFLGWFHGAVILITTGSGCKGGFWRLTGAPGKAFPRESGTAAMDTDTEIHHSGGIAYGTGSSRPG